MAVRSPKGKPDTTGTKSPSASAVKPTRRRAKSTTGKSTTAKAPTPEATTAPSGLTPIRVHYNVGPGNRITGRGDTDPFVWDRGIDARNTAEDVWEFQLAQVPAGQTFHFKPLINDMNYSAGENYVGTGGQTLDIYPVF
jgi:hypothetical protein